MNIHFQTHGLEQTAEILASLPARALAAAREEMLAQGELVRETAAALCPRETGLTADNITCRDRSTQRKVAVEVRTGTRAKMRIPATDPYYYPAAIEFGTATRHARPFMRPALEQHRASAARAVGRAVEREVSKR
ncbi:MAG TPA: HK97-gp10 family putative phage morphogenesis protein [Pirellulales bacterium]